MIFSKPQNINVTAFWYWKGWHNIKSGNYLNAIECFKQTLLNDESNFQALFIIACIYELLGFYQTAKDWFSVCLQRKKYNKKVYFSLALCSFKIRDYEKAKNYISFILKNNDKLKLSNEILYLNIMNLTKYHGSRPIIIEEYQYFLKNRFFHI